MIHLRHNIYWQILDIDWLGINYAQLLKLQDPTPCFQVLPAPQNSVTKG